MQEKDHDSGRTTILRLAGIAFSVLVLLGFVASQANYSSNDSPFAVESATDSDSAGDRQSRDVTALPGRTPPDTSRSDRGGDSSSENPEKNGQKSSGTSDNDAAPKADTKSGTKSGTDTGSTSDDTSSDTTKQLDRSANDGKQAGQAASSGPGRPDFVLPFECGSEWELTTYAGHDPENEKVDFFNSGGSSEGKQVLASASGTVTELVDPGGVKIEHSNGWWTLSLHMEDIQVSPGDKVKAGEPIGKVGTVGTDAAHLHYEQLYNPDGGEAHTDSHITLPKFAGEKYRLIPDSDFPVTTSKNSCG